MNREVHRNGNSASAGSHIKQYAFGAGRRGSLVFLDTIYRAANDNSKYRQFDELNTAWDCFKDGASLRSSVQDSATGSANHAVEQPIDIHQDCYRLRHR